MEPLPEVRAAAERLAAVTGIDVLDNLDAMARLAVSIVPSCVGLSVTLVLDGEAFTVTATSRDASILDAVQYLNGGPCLDSADHRREVSVPDVLDEDRWQLYEQAANSLGVRSSLSIPIAGSDGQTPGAINLYASDPHAFTGKEKVLAEAFRVSAEHLVSNADLSFMTRDFARQLPRQLEVKAAEDEAVGVLMATHGWPADQARARLRQAAVRANAPVDKVAAVVLALHAD
jgi:GAF domain-containing protein